MIDTIDAATLAAWLRDGGELALIDVREAGQFGEGHLFFATTLPYSRLELDAGRLIPRAATRIVVHDGGDDRLARLAASGCVRLATSACSCFLAEHAPGPRPDVRSTRV